MVQRRAGGEPLEQVVGWADFCGLRIALLPGVFVPRHRTELLVREAAALAPPAAVVLDLCCGSGALGAALRSMADVAELYACDVHPSAVECARGNLPGAAVFLGDLFDPLPRQLRGRVDILLANTPYVPSDEIALLPAEARDHEPRDTLDGGPDGLDLQRRVAAEAARWLVPGGHVLVEVSDRQVAVAAGIFRAAGLSARIASDEDLAATVVIATRA
jgi:release factor glutamine methyltransferase